VLKYKSERTNISHTDSQGGRKDVPVCNQPRIMKTKSGIGLCLYAFSVSVFDLRWVVSFEVRQLYQSRKNKSTHGFVLWRRENLCYCRKSKQTPPPLARSPVTI